MSTCSPKTMIFNAQLEILMIRKHRKTLYKTMNINNFVENAKLLSPQLKDKLKKVQYVLLAKAITSKKKC